MRKPRGSRKRASIRDKKHLRSESSGAGGGLLLAAIVAAVVWFSKREPASDPGHLANTPLACPRATPEEDPLICYLPQGMVAFNAPHDMTKGKAHVISLVISGRSDSSLTLVGTIRATTGDSTSTVVAKPIRIASRMVARLEGQGFLITPPASEAKPVAVGRVARTQWDWQVTPQSKGEQLLVLTIDALISPEGVEAPYPQTVMRHRVNVHVAASDRLWSFLTGINAIWAVISGLALAFWFAVPPWWKRRQSKRKDRSATLPQTGIERNAEGE